MNWPLNDIQLLSCLEKANANNLQAWREKGVSWLSVMSGSTSTSQANQWSLIWKVQRLVPGQDRHCSAGDTTLKCLQLVLLHYTALPHHFPVVSQIKCRDECTSLSHELLVELCRAVGDEFYCAVGVSSHFFASLVASIYSVSPQLSLVYSDFISIQVMDILYRYACIISRHHAQCIVLVITFWIGGGRWVLIGYRWTDIPLGGGGR